MNKQRTFLMAICYFLLCSFIFICGCTPSKYIKDFHYLDNDRVMYHIVDVDSPRLNDYMIICEIQSDGTEKNCVQSNISLNKKGKN